MKEDRKAVLAEIVLFGVSMIWGSSFFVTKSVVEVFPPVLLIATRFSFTTLVLCAIFFRRLKNIDKDCLKAGLIIGVFLFLGQMLQTLGIQTTTPGKNAFLTGVYCVIVPFLFWAMCKQKPDRYNVIAAFVCVLGIGLVSLGDDLSMEIGDLLSLLGGVMFAFHIVTIAMFSQHKDPVLLSILQFALTGALAWPASLIMGEGGFPAMNPTLFGSLMYLSIVVTGVAMLLQNVCQKYAHVAPASIIMSLESVFGVFFSVIFYGEELTPRLVAGFAIIFFAVVLSTTKLSFLRKKTKKPEGKTLGEKCPEDAPEDA